MKNCILAVNTTVKDRKNHAQAENPEQGTIFAP